MSANQAWYARAEKVLPGGHLSPSRKLGQPYAFVRAEGAYLFDADGHRHTDFHCGFGAHVLGHGHPAIRDRVFEVAQRMDLMGAGITDLEVEVAETLVGYIPCAEQIAFCNSGSEATYHALRLARAATGRKRIIKFQGGYHGWHDYVAMNGQTARDRIGQFDPMSDGILHAAAEYTAILPYNDSDAVEQYLKAHPGEVAAIIVEPIAHNMGAVAAMDTFLKDLRCLTRDHGVVLIFDEVITGFRHALGGYQSIVGVTPDLATFGKAASSGYPVGFIAGRRNLMHLIGLTGPKGVFMGGTCNGTPSTLAAVQATLEELARPGTYEKLFELGDYMRAQLNTIVQRLGIPAQSAGYGSAWLLYFFEGPYRQYTDLFRNDDARDMTFRRRLIERRYIFQPMQLKRLYLSTAHTRQILDESLEVIEDVLKTLV